VAINHRSKDVEEKKMAIVLKKMKIYKPRRNQVEIFDWQLAVEHGSDSISQQ
jgi:hypothetical protein